MRRLTMLRWRKKLAWLFIAMITALTGMLIIGGCAILNDPDFHDLVDCQLSCDVNCIPDGEGWKCPEPDPTPTPTPTPTPEPEPTPTPEPEPEPAACDFPQGIPDSEFTGYPVSSVHAKVVNKVMAEMTGCNIGSRCVHKESPQEFMQLVVAALRERGLCAGQHRAGEIDEIAVSDSCTGLWEGYHITTYAAKPTVVWSPGANRASYTIPAKYCSPTPDPDPTPEPLLCPDPVPDINQLRLDVKYHGRNKWDLTPKLIRVCKYCDDIGMGYHNGQIRCSCPVRPEGHADRSACERFVMGGDPRWFCNNQEIESTANPYQAVCVGEVKACTQDLCICSEGVR